MQAGRGPRTKNQRTARYCRELAEIRPNDLEPVLLRWARAGRRCEEVRCAVDLLLRARQDDEVWCRALEDAFERLTEEEPPPAAAP